MTTAERTPASVGASTADWNPSDGWYRPGSVHFHASGRDRSLERDYSEIKKHVLDGWLPAAPFITKDKLITAFGSCFAYHVEDFLRAKGYTTSIGKYGKQEETNYWSDSLLIKCGEGFVNTYSTRYQLEWLWEGSEPDVKIWHKSEGRLQQYIDDNRDAGRQMLDETEVFIITLGLSEVWYRKDTGRVMWTGVPASEFDPDKYGFRVTSVAENLSNLVRVVTLIRKHRGDVPIIFTLSPVPLNATYRPVSCISANAVSKAVLRVAVDELMRARTDDKELFYFPSYELVTSYLQDPYKPGDMGHPATETTLLIMGAFLESYCLG